MSNDKKIDTLAVNLGVTLFKKKIKNPIILGSGTLVETYEDIAPFRESGIGAIVPRTTRKIMERKTHPIPHLYQMGSRRFPAMLNAEWTGADITYWEPYLEELAQAGDVIPSVSGRNISECVHVCQVLEKYNSWLYYEINLSCAHSNNVHGLITRDREHIEKLINSIKSVGIETPIAIKLGHSDQIVELACIAKHSGADGIVAINTFGPVFDFSIDGLGQPHAVVGVEEAKGGLSGSPIFQMALTDIAEIKRQADIEVIGCGGVVTAEDVVKMLMAGASAVQVYTAAHAYGTEAPHYFSKLIEKLQEYCFSHDIRELQKVIGRALPLLNQKSKMELIVPVVSEEKCIGCDLCLPICLPKAIDIKALQFNSKVGHVVSINNDFCVGCGHCVAVCPTNPKALEFPLLAGKK